MFTKGTLCIVREVLKLQRKTFDRYKKLRFRVCWNLETKQANEWNPSVIFH
jgi:hypothetical protein